MKSSSAHTADETLVTPLNDAIPHQFLKMADQHAAVIVLTILFLVPINNCLARPGAASISDAARAERKRWDTMHRFCVAALATSLVCFLMAVSV